MAEGTTGSGNKPGGVTDSLAPESTTARTVCTPLVLPTTLKAAMPLKQDCTEAGSSW